MNKGAKLMEARAKIRERRAQLRKDTMERTSAASPIKTAGASAIGNSAAGLEESRMGASVTSPVKSRPLSSRAPIKLSINTKVTGLTGLTASEAGPDAIKILNDDAMTAPAAAAAPAAAPVVAPAPTAAAAAPDAAVAHNMTTTAATAPASPPRDATIPALSSAAATVSPPRPSAEVEAAAMAPNSVEKPVYEKGFFGGVRQTRGHFGISYFCIFPRLFFELKK